MSFSPKDSVLRAQVLNFSSVLATAPATYQQTPATATAVTAAVTTYVDSLDALTEARANGVRSAIMTGTKDVNRQAMLNLLKPIYAFVQNSEAVSDPDKTALGVHVRDTHNTPQPVPGFAPLQQVVKWNGRVATLRFGDPNEPDSKSRPIFTAGISIFSYAGEEPPVHASDFKFEGNTGLMTATIAISPTVAIGSTVYYTSFFFNNRKQSGPAASPLATTVGGGSTMPFAEAE